MENNRNLWRGIRNSIFYFLLFILCVVATLAILDMAFDISPAAISQYLFAQVGSAIGMSTAVPPNPFNTLSRQLEEKEKALLEKEAGLAEKEELLAEKTDGKNHLLIGGGILLILILLNFYLDYRRRH